MAIQTRYAGDSNGVDNVDSAYAGAGVIVATGLTKAPIALKVINASTGGNLAAELGVGGAVETILRQIEIDSSITMYQVETSGTQISVLLEATGAGSESGGAIVSGSQATAIQTRIAALGNIGIASNVWANATVITSSEGFKLY